MNPTALTKTLPVNDSDSTSTENTVSLTSLITCFNDTFFTTYNTRLVAGDSEPYYLPAYKGEVLEQKPYHQIIFAHFFIASALHEVAHWCVAGDKRRQLPDYGYWYCPDGRSAAEQKKFEQVEVKPQAIEWVFSKALQKPFRISKDNIDNSEGLIKDTEFEIAVLQQVYFYCEHGLPSRAEQFRSALVNLLGTTTDTSLIKASYTLAEIV